MKKMLWKTIVFVLFCVATVIVIDCTDNLIVSMSEFDEVTVNGAIGVISDLTVRTGYTDSLPAIVLVAVEGIEELNPKNEGYIDSLRSRIKRFHLSWQRAEGADGYEIRVLGKPITDKNWYLAQKVSLARVSYSGDKVSAEALLDPRPEILTGKCIDCGACVSNCPVNAITSINGDAVIDYNKCVECGECFRSCDYDAVKGTFAGTEYYFAVRAQNDRHEYSDKIYCTTDAYKMQYTTISDIPDSLKFPGVEGCMGNCDFEGCFIVFPENEICHPISKRNRRTGSGNYKNALKSVCPVDAVYSIGTDSLTVLNNNTQKGAIFIDKDKCVNCGRCAGQCYVDGGYGSVTTEILRITRFFTAR